MALLGVYINAGTACLGTGLACFLHGIAAPFTPDYASYQLITGGAICLPIALESLGVTTVVWRNNNAAGVNGNMFVARFQELIR